MLYAPPDRQPSPAPVDAPEDAIDPRAHELQRQLDAGPPWAKLAGILLGVMAFILSAARIQFGVVLGLELTPVLLMMPVAIGTIFGTLLATAWFFYQRTRIHAELLGHEQARNSRILANLERMVETRSQQLREAEAQMLTQQKFAAIGRMSGGIAHDFNNLLTTIALGISELGEAEVDADERAQLLEAVTQACERGADIVRQLRAISSAEEHEPELVDLVQLVRRDLSVWRTLAAAGIEIDSQLPDETLTVRIDPAQFHRVILNLVANACQAMGERGHLSLCVRHDAAAREGQVIVADDAGGIPQAALDKIFEPFFTTRETGTGLGLSVVHGIVKQAGGRVDVESSTAGTRFTISFPLVDEG